MGEVNCVRQHATNTEHACTPTVTPAAILLFSFELSDRFSCQKQNSQLLSSATFQQHLRWRLKVDSCLNGFCPSIESLASRLRLLFGHSDSQSHKTFHWNPRTHSTVQQKHRRNSSVAKTNNVLSKAVRPTAAPPCLCGGVSESLKDAQCWRAAAGRSNPPPRWLRPALVAFCKYTSSWSATRTIRQQKQQ